MELRHVEYSVEEGTACIRLDRPEQRNALNRALIEELRQVLQEAAADPEVRVLLICGNGNAFCAGGDLSDLIEAASEGQTSTQGFVELLLSFSRLHKPKVAKVHGPALGGGLGLVLACDLAVAAENAVFGTPEISVGLWPMVIMALMQRHLGPKQAMRLMLGGERIDAEEALRIGLVSEVVHAEDLDTRVAQMVGRLASRPASVICRGLAAYQATADLPLEQALPSLGTELQALLASEDTRSGIRAFLEKQASRRGGR